MLDANHLRWSLDAMTIGTLLIVAASLKVFPKLWDITVGRVDRFRVHTLDGARGVLTTWVLSHHLLMGSSVDAHGVWHAPTGALGALITSGFFVAPFFMLTAMLFGGRLVATGGKLTAAPFFITRAFRLVPAYTVAVALLVLGAFIASEFHLHVSASHLLKELMRWMLFDFVARYDINGIDMTAGYGVLWTLRYEIIFYALLPVIAVAQRRLHSRLLPIPTLFVLGYFMWPFFFFGAGTLAVLGVRTFAAPRARLWCQVAAVAGIVAIVISASHGIVHHLMQALCLVPVFICLAMEAPLVKFLSWRPLRLIGEISYSNYVLHGAVLYILGSTVLDFSVIIQLPLVPRIAALTLIGSVALGSALVCFVLVEQPFIRLGATLAGRFNKVSSLSPARQTVPTS